MITIVDYGMGNLHSVEKAFDFLGAEVRVSEKPEDVKAADKLVLPGVGAFADGMGNLRKAGLVEALQEEVIGNKKPVLGICLGMQLLATGSEEGKLKGLGWLDAKTMKFKFDPNEKLKVPHMGWNRIKIIKEKPLLKDMPKNARFYFVHSYYVKCANSKDVAATTNYGTDFASIVQKGNIYGAQFHPEKSHRFGMKLLENFAKG